MLSLPQTNNQRIPPELTILDAMEQNVLTSMARLSSLPATVFPTIAVEWGITTEKNVHHHSQGP